MKFFHQIEGEQAIIRSGGVFKQVDLYSRGDDRVVFAKVGSGYIRLLDNGKTSHPKTFWDEASIAFETIKHGYQVMEG